MLAQNPLWIANRQRTSLVNFHRDVAASMHGDFFQGQIVGELIYGLTISGKLGSTNKKKDQFT